MLTATACENNNENNGDTVGAANDSYTLSVTIDHAEMGNITSNPSGIDCGSQCSHVFPANSTVYLTANTVSSAYSFVGWGGDSGCGAQLKMDKDRQCIAMFSAVCDYTPVNFVKPIPYVILMLDASGSMATPLGNSTIFNTAVSALLDASQGALSAVNDKFAVSAYAFQSLSNSPTCPALTSSGDPALNSATAIKILYDNTTVEGNGPLAESVISVTNDFNKLSLPADASKSLVLITDDSLPDSCDATATGGPAAVTALLQSFQSGIRGYVISISDANANADLFTELANAGIGINNPAAFVDSLVSATDLSSASSALSQVFGDIEQCRFIPDQIPATEFANLSLELDVGLGKQALIYGQDWVIVGDSSTIALVGLACKSFQAAASPQLSAQLQKCSN